MKFSQKVLFLRKKRGLTQTELAKLTGLTQGSISQFEAGKIKPKADALLSLAKVLNIDPAALMNDERKLS